MRTTNSNTNNDRSRGTVSEADLNQRRRVLRVPRNHNLVRAVSNSPRLIEMARQWWIDPRADNDALAAHLASALSFYIAARRSALPPNSITVDRTLAGHTRVYADGSVVCSTGHSIISGSMGGGVFVASVALIPAVMRLMHERGQGREQGRGRDQEGQQQ